jgi:hypothetical protein
MARFQVERPIQKARISESNEKKVNSFGLKKYPLGEFPPCTS